MRGRIPLWVWPIVGALWMWPGVRIPLLFDNPNQPPAPGPEGPIVYWSGLVMLGGFAAVLSGERYPGLLKAPFLVALGWGIAQPIALYFLAT